MTILPVILGQAPSRLGDGRPFTGPSGDTLIDWAGVKDRDELLTRFRLDNLLHTPIEPYRPRTDGTLRRNSSFTRSMGKRAAYAFVERERAALTARVHDETEALEWLKYNQIEVVALGRKVWEAMGLHSDAPLFSCRTTLGDFKVWKLPHPSGLNHERNDPYIMAETRKLLRLIGDCRSITYRRANNQ